MTPIRLIFACCLVLSSAAQSAEKLDGDKLLQPDRVTKIEVRLDDTDWARLRRESPNTSVFSGNPSSTEYTYFKADVSVDGVWIESVGIRKKGFFGSNDRQRPSLKIKFDEFVKQDPIKGLSRLTLNNNKQDTSLLSQYLSYKLFRAAGIKAPRCGFAAVTVNGEYLGVYSHVESIKKPFLAKAFGDKTGKLYEGTLTDFYPRAIDKIEAKTKASDADRMEITQLAELIAPDQELDLETLGKVIDVDYFMTFWAMEGLLRFWDGYSANQNNFYVYVHPKSRLAYFIPWGADACLTTDGGPFARFGNRGPTSVYAQSFLTSQLLKSPASADAYRERMQRLLTDVWDEEALLAECDRVEKLLLPHVGNSQQDLAKRVEVTREFIRTRRDVVEKELAGTWPPSITREPRKPAYTVPVGTARGTFAANWSARAIRDVTDAGEAKLTLQLNDKPVEFSATGAGAWMNTFRGFRPGSEAQPQQANVVLAATRKENGNRLSITLTIAPETLQHSGEKREVTVTGRLTESEPGSGNSRFGGSGGFGGGFGRPRGGTNLTVTGKLILTDGGTEDGDRIAGEVDLQIAESRGGFRFGGGGGFGRGGFGGRGGGGFGGGGFPPPGNRNSPTPQRPSQSPLLMGALDANNDGRISEAELNAATENLRKLDRNNDGELSADELRQPGPPQRSDRPQRPR